MVLRRHALLGIKLTFSGTINLTIPMEWAASIINYSICDST